MCWLVVVCWRLRGGLVVTTEDAPPFNFAADDGKTVVGSATEAVQEMFRRAKLEHTITLYPWMRAITMARTDKDTCVYSTTRTEEREKTFVGGASRLQQLGVFARANSTIKLDSFDDARKFKIGGYRGDAVALYLKALKFNVDESYYDDQNAKKLEGGRIDLWATGSQNGPYFAAKKNVKIKPLLEFKQTELYLACNLSVPADTIPNSMPRSRPWPKMAPPTGSTRSTSDPRSGGAWGAYCLGYCTTCT
ncbi:ABC transporter substrate-binding protein [Rhodoferax sp. AJA081-3]|uniref:substrate-binding periplasmic protein n=1 Tax=Rhodoferax sp. AJA081-3 TaxID=2752316 RepID=UPI001AE08987|nr:ABC transporter substrate-binding protein [Rhodoferax sp. AJA081-3]QTN30396.1 ABC transporter substrate-binding protein [Rhodoferax sp. AJA081-3]